MIFSYNPFELPKRPATNEKRRMRPCTNHESLCPEKSSWQDRAVTLASWFRLAARFHSLLFIVCPLYELQRSLETWPRQVSIFGRHRISAVDHRGRITIVIPSGWNQSHLIPRQRGILTVGLRKLDGQRFSFAWYLWSLCKNDEASVKVCEAPSILPEISDFREFRKFLAQNFEGIRGKASSLLGQP